MVTLIGSWPSPIGGVSAFISRLIKKDNGKHIIELIDIYSGEKQDNFPSEVTHQTPPKQSLKWTWLLKAIINTKSEIIHFNFSSSKSLYLIALCYKKKKHKWVLTLHNGNLSFNSFFEHLIFKLAIKKIDVVTTLSSKQERFYNSIGRSNIITTTSYIYYPSEKPNTKKDWMVDWEKKSSSYKHKFIASGYPTEIYNHMHTINSIVCYDNAFITLFLYGPDSDNLLAQLREKSQLKNCEVYYGKSETDFNYILSKNDVYVRPNSSDSFGIVVADAINKNLIVLASNVCKRYQGTITFSTLEEYDKLISKIINGDILKQENDNNKIDSYEHYINIYRSLSLPT